MKSSMAAPSLRNSGLLATSTACRGCAPPGARPGARLVPTGTVLLMTTIFGPGQDGGQGVADGPDAGQVGGAVRGLRRADGDEDQLARRDAAWPGRS